MAEVNEEKLGEFAGKVMGDVAGAMGVLMAFLGDRADVYRSLAAHGPMNYKTLAEHTNMNPLYLREWLSANAALGYINYDAGSGQFSLTPEQTVVMAQEGHPACMQGFLQSVVSQFETYDKALETFVTGDGRPWGDHSQCMFCGVDRFFRPGYEANLLEHWIPALDGVQERLTSGAKVIDIACGHGSSTILMATAFPNSRFLGVDFHSPSIEEANAKAEKSKLDNVQFEVATAKDYPGDDYDLACIFDALHDMGDPEGAAAHIRSTLKSDGSLMLVEPLAGDSLPENMHPLGAIFYSFSTVVCTPCSVSQEVGLGLGTQAGQKRLTEVLRNGGFSSVNRVSETPTNMVLEAR